MAVTGCPVVYPPTGCAAVRALRKPLSECVDSRHWMQSGEAEMAWLNRHLSFPATSQSDVEANDMKATICYIDWPTRPCASSLLFVRTSLAVRQARTAAQVPQAEVTWAGALLCLFARWSLTTAMQRPEEFEHQICR